MSFMSLDYYEKKQFINLRSLDFMEIRFFEKLNNLFHWKSESIQIPKNFETLIRLYGSIGFVKSEKKFVVGFLDGNFDEDGNPVGYDAYHLNTNGNTGSHKYKVGEEVILLRNNSLYLPDYPFIHWYCQMLKETDISIRYQLINSRLLPIIGVNSDQSEKQMKEIFNTIEAGKPFVYKKDLMDDTQMFNIMDNGNIDKMQYLTSFSESLNKRLYSEFGIDMNVKDKRAQVSVEEIKGENDVTTLNYLSYYEGRLEFAKEMQEAGYDIEVIPSPIYATEPQEEEIEDPEAARELMMEEKEPEAASEEVKETEEEKNEEG